MTGFGATAVLAALILAARRSKDPDHKPIDRSLLISALPPFLSGYLIVGALLDRLLDWLA